MAIPELHIEMKTLSADEIRQILPPVIQLGRIEEALTLGTPSARNVSPIRPLVAIFAGTVLMLVAYRLIPRAHSQVLRVRSMDLSRDLFT